MLGDFENSSEHLDKITETDASLRTAGVSSAKMHQILQAERATYLISYKHDGGRGRAVKRANPNVARLICGETRSRGGMLRRAASEALGGYDAPRRDTIDVSACHVSVELSWAVPYWIAFESLGTCQ
jgi:hypothetical protein